MTPEPLCCNSTAAVGRDFQPMRGWKRSRTVQYLTQRERSSRGDPDEAHLPQQRPTALDEFHRASAHHASQCIRRMVTGAWIHHTVQLGRRDVRRARRRTTQNCRAAWHKWTRSSGVCDRSQGLDASITPSKLRSMPDGEARRLERLAAGARCGVTARHQTTLHWRRHGLRSPLDRNRRGPTPDRSSVRRKRPVAAAHRILALNGSNRFTPSEVVLPVESQKKPPPKAGV